MVAIWVKRVNSLENEPMARRRSTISLRTQTNTGAVQIEPEGFSVGKITSWS